MAYATIEDIEVRYGSDVPNRDTCLALIEDASTIIDLYNEEADDDKKTLVVCRMVIRALGSIGNDMPIGATQGTTSALGYSQTWTLSNGSTGELYLSKLDKKLLGCTAKIGAHSVLEDL